MIGHWLRYIQSFDVITLNTSWLNAYNSKIGRLWADFNYVWYWSVITNNTQQLTYIHKYLRHFRYSYWWRARYVGVYKPLYMTGKKC